MKKTTCKLFTLLATIALGCGDDSTTTMADVGTDVSLDAMDAMVSGDPVPFEFSLSVVPARSSYLTGQSIRLEGEAFDIDGEVIEGAGFTVETPEGATEVGTLTYTLDTEGHIRFDGCTTLAGPDGEPVCGFARILVDDGAPLLEVTSPLPGAELGADVEARVEGSVTDSRDTRVFINGDPVEVDELGVFSAPLDGLLFGINHLEIVASDMVSAESRVEMDVLYAPFYRGASEGTTTNRTDDGIGLQLGQRFFDDGTGTETFEANDLADILQLVLENADLASLLPDPLIGSSGIMLHAEDVRVDGVDVEVMVAEGGLEIFAQITDVQIDTSGSLSIDETSLDLAGGLGASLSIYAFVEVRKDSPEMELESSVAALEIAIESVEGRFDSAEANSIVALADGFLRMRLEEMLRLGVGTSFLDAVPRVLTDGLGSLDSALRDRVIELSTGFFPDMQLTLDGRLARIESSPLRHLLAPMNFTTSTDQESVHPESRGYADLPVGSDSVLFDAPVSLGARLAVLNQLMHTLWTSGLLEIDASSALPDDISGGVEEAVMSGKIAPVIRPTRGAEMGTFVMSIGQLELNLTALGDQVHYGISIEAEATVDIVDGALSLAVDGDPNVRVWIIEATTPNPLLNEEVLAALVREELWPSLSDELLPGLRFELPSFALGDLSDVAPALAGYSLAVSLAEPVEVRQHTMVAELELRGSL